MKRCFKKYELPVKIELRQDKIKDLQKEAMGCAGGDYHDWNNKLTQGEIILRETDDNTIAHELVHISRFVRYGHTDPKCHDEMAVEKEAIRRLKKS